MLALTSLPRPHRISCFLCTLLSLFCVPLNATTTGAGVTGQVLLPDATGLPDVWLTGLPNGAVTGADGRVRVDALEGWSGKVTPWLPGYRFEPESVDLVGVTGEVEVQFQAFERRPGFSRLWLVDSDGSLRQAGIFAEKHDVLLLTPGSYFYDNGGFRNEDIFLLGDGNDPSQVVFEHTRLTLDVSRIMADGLTFRTSSDSYPAVRLVNASDFRFRNCRFESSHVGFQVRSGTAGGVLLEGSQFQGGFSGLLVDPNAFGGYLTVRNSSAFDHPYAGIEILDNPTLEARVENVMLQRNYLGIELGELESLHLENLIITGSQRGIDSDDFTGCDVQVVQSVIASNNLGVDVRTDFDVYDSIFFDNSCGFEGAGVVKQDHMMRWGSPNCGGPFYPSGNVVWDADPLFVNPANGDFQLQAGSPAIGAGRNGQDLGAYGGPLGDAWQEPSSIPVPALLELVPVDLRRTFDLGETFSPRVDGRFERGWAGSVTSEVIWTSADTSIASPLGNGQFEIVGEGEVVLSGETRGQAVELAVRGVAGYQPQDGRATGSVQPADEISQAPISDEKLGERAHVDKALDEAEAWVLAAPLSRPREQHTATLLNDGRVLVAGGLSTLHKLNLVEIYDPVADRWQIASPMSFARQEHTATLLPDGRVLVAGGRDDVGRLDSVEIYDVAADQWTAAAPMGTPRASHRATVLQDGRVLMVAGTNEIPGSAEIFDPSSGSWTATMPLNGRRGSSLTSTLLSDGRVLVVDDGEAEFFGPNELGEWVWTSITDSLAREFSAHTATLLHSGQVLFAGGFPANNLETYLFHPLDGQWTPAGPIPTGPDMPDAPIYSQSVLLGDGRVLLAGDAWSARTDTPVWDPATSQWSTAGFLNAGSSASTATLLADGRVLFAGGRGNLGTAARVEIFLPGLPEHSGASPDLFEPRHRFAAVQLADGRPLVAGGTHSASVSGVEVLRADGTSWESWPPLLTGGERTGAVVLPDGDILVVGRFDAERFDTESGVWRMTGPRQFVFERSRLLQLSDGRVLAVSGAGSEIYDPETDSWATTGPMVRPRSDGGLVLLTSGEAMSIGGRDPSSGSTFFGVVPDAEIYDPEEDTWRSTGELRIARQRFVTAVLPSGQILVAGGDQGELVYSSAELYDPSTGTWTLTRQDMTSPRHSAAGVTIPGGQVLVIGGGAALRESNRLASSEIYDPGTDTWRPGPSLELARDRHAAFVGGEGVWVVGGRDEDDRALNSVELISAPSMLLNRPVIDTIDPSMRHGEPLTLSGTGFGGGPEGHGGTLGGTALNFPIVRLRSLVDGRVFHLAADPRVDVDPRPSFFDDPMELTVSTLPADLLPGPYQVSVVRGGVASEPLAVMMECSIAIAGHPTASPAEIGESILLTVEARGGHLYQWRKNGTAIPGAEQASYLTPPLEPDDAWAEYDVVVSNGCTETVSDPVQIEVIDLVPPSVNVVSPSGGEFWLLTLDDEPSEAKTLVWEMEDNIRICRVEVHLQYSDDGQSWQSVDGAPVAIFDQTDEMGICLSPGVQDRSATYFLGADLPSGQIGSSYRLQVIATDQAGQSSQAEGDVFSIVPRDPEGIRSLILTYPERMRSIFIDELGLDDDGSSPPPTPIQELDQEMDGLASDLRLLADHQRVDGLVIDVSRWSSVAQLYDAWDVEHQEAADASVTGIDLEAQRMEANQAANDVLFAPGGIHDRLGELLHLFPAVEFLVLVGDDRVLPMARLQDGATLLDEGNYIGPGGLERTEPTSVGLALDGKLFLSDDRLAVQFPTADVGESLYLPDRAIGRLVEHPSEIRRTISAFFGIDGVVDVIPPETEEGAPDQRILVTGYDFLSDVAEQIAEYWRESYGLEALDPEIRSLISGAPLGWTETDLEEAVCALGSPYRVLSFNGHAHHYGEGIPGLERTDIRSLETDRLTEPGWCNGSDLDLEGRVLYSVGCHGGLPVPGSDFGDANHSLDLPQTYLGLGAVAYLANSGYGWGLNHGVGYGERLVQIFTEELSRTGTVTLGRAVAAAKLRYYLETYYFDAYDRKTLMQWTFFGLPMVGLRTGLVEDGDPDLEPIPGSSSSGPALHLASPEASPELEAETLVSGQGEQAFDLPEDMALTEVRIRLSEDLYEKKAADGSTATVEAGCDHEEGCYYSLSGLAAARATGSADLPLLPYLVYDSRLAGFAQHGVLWKGGAYVEEDGWTPVMATLVSNGELGEPNNAPQELLIEPIDTHWPPEGGDCRRSDLSPASLVATVGELRPGADGTPFGRHRRYLDLDLEIFYLGHEAEGRCDRRAPTLGQAPYDGQYHRRIGSYVEWSVPIVDEDIWRVVVVVDTGMPDPEDGLTRWQALDLDRVPESRRFEGGFDTLGSDSLRYVIQAIDKNGNVGWLECIGSCDSGESQASSKGQSSGIELVLPRVVVTESVPGDRDLSIAVSIDQPQVEPGSAVELSLDVVNQSIEAAGEVMVDLEIPFDLSFESFRVEGESSLSLWSCEEEPAGPSTASVACRRPYLDGGESVRLIVNLAVADHPASFGSRSVRSEVASQDSEVNPADNEAGLTLWIVDPRRADLSLSFDNGSDTVLSGEIETWTLVTTNHGPSTVEGILIAFDFGQLEGPTLFASQGALGDDDVWRDLELLPGDQASLTLEGFVPETASSPFAVSVSIYPQGLLDPDGGASAVDIDIVIDDPAPQVEQIRTVSESGNAVEDGLLIESAVTQIRVLFSEPVSGEGPAAAQWIDPGPDGLFETLECSSLAGDDELKSLGIIRPSATEVVLDAGPSPLSKGGHRFLLCPEIKDDQGQSLPDGSGVLNLHVDPAHLLENPNFDDSLNPWVIQAPDTGSVTWFGDDAGEAPTSGSARALGSTADTAVVSQCLELTEGPYLWSVSLRSIGLDPVAGSVGLEIRHFETSDCSGTPLSSFEGDPISLSEVWTTLDLTSFVVPPATGSTLVGAALEVTSTEAFDVLLDDMWLAPETRIFSHGFESGDTSGWSSTFGESP